MNLLRITKSSASNSSKLLKSNQPLIQVSVKLIIDRAEKDKVNNQLKMAENLHKGFEKKYKDILQSAKDIEKEEEDKRKSLIEELQ